jgi:hypothetical protein
MRFEKIQYSACELKIHNYKKCVSSKAGYLLHRIVAAELTCLFLVVKMIRTHPDASRLAIHSCDAKNHRSGWE